MASTYLTRTPSSAGNKKTFTISTWFKLSGFQTNSIFCTGTASTSFFHVFSSSSGRLSIDDWNNSGSYYNLRWSTPGTTVFNDRHGWYHIVISVDTTQASASDRVKVYLNGENISSLFTQLTTPNQNADLFVNVTERHLIGNRFDLATFYDGLMTHFHFCDGYAYAASDFGETDSTTGQWIAKSGPSVSYGTNGFFVLRDNNGVTDQSGNGNNFTIGGGTLTDTKDCPTNVFATLNGLAKNGDGYNNTLSFGNTRQTTLSTAGKYTPSASTLGMVSGKYYAEMKVDTMPANCFVGIDGDSAESIRNAINFGSSPYGYCYAQWGGKYHNDVSTAGAGATFGPGDIIGIAVDLDNNYIYFSKNGVWQNSGDPTSGSSGTGAFYNITAAENTSDQAYFFQSCNNDADGNAIFDWNFGNGYFGGTAVASAGTNASGNGIFEYDVPTGYTALSTKGLNL